MAYRNVSPLFMPPGSTQGNTFPSKRGNGGNGNGNDNGKDNVNGDGDGTRSDSVSIKSKRITPELSSIPQFETYRNQAYWDDHNSKIARIPGVYWDEGGYSSSPLPHMYMTPPTGMPTPPPRPFAPLLSRNEHRRRRAAAEQAAREEAAREESAEESAVDDEALAWTSMPTRPALPFAPLTSRAEKNKRKAAAEAAAREQAAEEEAAKEQSSDESVTDHDDLAWTAMPTRPPRPFAPLTSRAEKNRRKAAAESAAKESATSNVATALANTALETACRDMQTAADLAGLAIKNATMHNMIAKNALQGNVPALPVTQATAAPPVPTAAAQPVTPARSSPPIPRAEPLKPADLLTMARRRLGDLTADLRRQENEACDREDRLETLLGHARDIRSRAMQDRSNGLVIVRDRRKRLAALEIRLLNDEGIDPDELVGLVNPLMLEEPVEREAFERMRVEGNEREVEYEDES